MKQNSILPYVAKPGRYIGGEHNSIHKPWQECSVHCALLFPDLYEIGMSHQGLQILYHIINNHPDSLAERGYCPDIDMAKQLKSAGLALTSLESGRPLNEFDLIGITLPYELCYTNILTILDLSGLELLSRDRDEHSPLIIGGGSCSMNPEPVADFFDAILLGDGEEGFIDIIEQIKEAKEENCSKQELLQRLSGIKGLYIPSFFEVDYKNEGSISRIKPLFKGYDTIHRRILPDLNRIDYLTSPLVPNCAIVHDRLGIEIARGCTRGCRFCQAGMIYRPVRERTPGQISDLARNAINNSGFNELALLSLSTGDYSCLDTLMHQLMDEFSDDYVSISMPSMRVGTLTQSVMDQIKRVRKTGFTVAPEAGSERLRQVINKGISEEDLLITCRDAFSLGWKLIKLYFMIGLPTETMDDIDDIVTLVKKAKQAGVQAGVGRKQINVSVGTFVPKPHTPFQWEPQISLDESKNRIDRLKQILPRKGFKLKWHDPKQSYLEGVFSRGDRRLADLLICAWNNGARLDSWSDHFNLDIWLDSAKQCGINFDDYLRRRELSETLPWDHLHAGVKPDFLKKELERAHKLQYTPDCRYHNCHKCGLCDFKLIKPIVHRRKGDIISQNDSGRTTTTESQGNSPSNQRQENHYKYMVSYEKRGSICFLGHLEILQLILRAIRRAKINVNFSQGYNPSPKISFSPPLPVGTESLAEFFIMDLPQLLKNCDQIILRLNQQLPSGLTVKEIQLYPGKFPQNIKNTFITTFPSKLTVDEHKMIDNFLDDSEVLIKRVRKGKARKINIRPLVENISAHDPNSLKWTLISQAGSPSIKVLEAIKTILPDRQPALLEIKVVKTSWRPCKN